MLSVMRQKDGYQSCPKCQGVGCWHCGNKGHVVRCPACGMVDHEIELGDEYECQVCGSVYDKKGQLLRQVIKEQPQKI